MHPCNRVVLLHYSLHSAVVGVVVEMSARAISLSQSENSEIVSKRRNTINLRQNSNMSLQVSPNRGIK